MTGHCSKCRKVWTLETEQGLCQWCGKLASSITRTQALRSIKSSRSRRQRQGPDNGYDGLEGEWLTYYDVASRFSHRAKAQDRNDLLHDMMLTFAEVTRNNGHKPLTEATMYRIASHTLANYWRSYYRLTHGLDCRWCTEAQRQACKVRISKPFADNLLANCPRAIKLESLSKPIVDSEGNMTELGELIADDKAIDLAEWVDQKTFLLGCPQRLIAIAEKISKGKGLTATDSQYLWRYRKRHQQALPMM